MRRTLVRPLVLVALTGCFTYDNPREHQANATVRGLFTAPNPATGAPSVLVGAQCSVEATDVHASTDSNGAIELDQVPPGSHAIACTQDGHTYVITIEVQAGETRDLGTVELAEKAVSCDVENGGCDPNAKCSTTFSVLHGTRIECRCLPDYIGEGKTCVLRGADAG
jgi:hypothetical protein